MLADELPPRLSSGSPVQIDWQTLRAQVGFLSSQQLLELGAELRVDASAFGASARRRPPPPPSSAAHNQSGVNRSASGPRHGGRIHKRSDAPPDELPVRECDADEGIYGCVRAGCTRECARQMLAVFGVFCVVCMAAHTFGDLLSPFGFPGITLFLGAHARRLRPR